MQPDSRALRHEPGVLHDAHRRNGIPSKIQHMAIEQDSNFSVMQIGMTVDREEAARLTSERTVAAAKTYDQSGYYSTIRKQRIRWAKTLAQAQRISLEEAARTQTIVKRTTPLSPPETKFEQARLLTLLRSLNPNVVVDQICKATAYFGGIPMDAPPPDCGAFPKSETGNGLGSNFVGWLAEIFPHMVSSSLHRLWELRATMLTLHHSPLLHQGLKTRRGRLSFHPRSEEEDPKAVRVQKCDPTRGGNM